MTKRYLSLLAALVTVHVGVTSSVAAATLVALGCVVTCAIVDGAAAVVRRVRGRAPKGSVHS